jgi:arginine decarboxylase
MGVESTATSDEVVQVPSNGQKEVKNHKHKKLLPPSPTTGDLPRSWKIEDSEALYRIEGWGQPYFSISAAGHVTVSPKGDRGGSLDLFELQLGTSHVDSLFRYFGRPD